MALASVLLIGSGLLGPVALVLWHQGRWLAAGEWIRDNVSVPAVVAVPVAGAFVASVGLMLVWPPAFVMAFTAAVALVCRLRTLARQGPGEWFPPALAVVSSTPAVRDQEEEGPVPQRRAG
jgi:hypothetical protein